MKRLLTPEGEDLTGLLLKALASLADLTQVKGYKALPERLKLPSAAACVWLYQALDLVEGWSLDEISDQVEQMQQVWREDEKARQTN